MSWLIWSSPEEQARGPDIVFNSQSTTTPRWLLVPLNKLVLIISIFQFILQNLPSFWATRSSKAASFNFPGPRESDSIWDLGESKVFGVGACWDQLPNLSTKMLDDVQATCRIPSPVHRSQERNIKLNVYILSKLWLQNCDLVSSHSPSWPKQIQVPNTGFTNQKI